MSEAEEDQPITGEELAARSALLDFYGDRAVAFASLFVASVFGTVTILAIAQGIEYKNIVSLIPICLSMGSYIVFAIAGKYTFDRYAFYATIAARLEECGVRKWAKLDKIKVSVMKDHTYIKKYMDKFLTEESEHQNRSYVKKYVLPRFGYIYLILVSILGAVVIFSKLLEIGA